MNRVKKLAKVASSIAAAALIVAGAAAGCSGGYGGPTEPDSTEAVAPAGR